MKDVRIMIFKIDNIYSTLGKILVYSGYGSNENGKYAEVIDLLNPEADCDIYAVLPKEVHFAFGGRVAQEFVICGGSTYAEEEVISKKCYKVGETTPFVELINPRKSGSSVVLSNNTLLLLGNFFIVIVEIEWILHTFSMNFSQPQF